MVHLTGSQNSALEAEITRVQSATRQMLNAYVAWGGQIKQGEVFLDVYHEVVDFVNFRMETAESCMTLIGSGKVGDALGLSRSLLENSLLMMLICRGPKYFQLQHLTSKTAEEFQTALDERMKIWLDQKNMGTTTCIDVRSYPRAARHIMYVFPGIMDSNGELLPVSAHYFHFQEFRPETMRLDPRNYFEYYEPDAELNKALKVHRKDATFRYRHFLSYDALLECLHLNNLIDEAAQARIEAHYTFLGKYLHPTNDAMRDLHDRPNVHDGKPSIGMNGNYSGTSRLLASLYVCYLVAGVLHELCFLFEAAKPMYIREAGTQELRKFVESVPRSFPYFWLIFNEAPLHDRFNWAVNHATNEQLKEFGGYAGVPSELIPFDQHIYSNLQNGLRGWSNTRVGSYQSPIEKQIS